MFLKRESDEVFAFANAGTMSVSRVLTPLARKFRYDIETLPHHEYMHHPTYFRDADFKPGALLYANKERADEMMYFTKESARLLDNILQKWDAKVIHRLLNASICDNVVPVWQSTQC